jgi:hypothetical protein
MELATTYSLTVRLPSGSDFWQSPHLPEVGETLVRSGDRYVVVSREQIATGVYSLHVTTREPASEAGPAAA